MSRNYDNWERLVGATLKREQLRALARADSLDSTSTFSSIQSDFPVDSPLHHDFTPSAVRILPTHVGGSSIKSLPTPRSPNLKAFSFNVLKNATRKFGSDSFLGEGVYGTVFKGWINGNKLTAAKPGLGLAVAVKKLIPELFHGHKDWLTGVIYEGQLHHPNLVRLIGYCTYGVHRFLVYEYMPKGNLQNHLLKRPQSLSWTTRIKFAVGAAKGLSFLHEAEQQLVYIAFKASYIFVDSKSNAKLCNFGLVASGTIVGRPYILTQFMDMDVYDAPEYIVTSCLTAKCNVYSFGVVLLELLSGRHALDHTIWGEQNIVDWAKPYLGDKSKVSHMMDIKLHGQYPHKDMYKVADIALQCLHIEPKQRPHMADVLAMLEELQCPESATEVTSLVPH